MASRKQITIDNVKSFNIRTMVEPDGNLVPLESNHEIPFNIKRIFYVYGVKDQKDRGEHAHHKTKQVLICLRGSVKVVCKDGLNSTNYLLNSPQKALYIPEMIWDEQTYYSEDSILLVISNTKYNPSDYIHDFEKFKTLKGIK